MSNIKNYSRFSEKRKKRCLRPAGMDREGSLEETRFKLAQRCGTTYLNIVLISIHFKYCERERVRESERALFLINLKYEPRI